MGCSFARLLIGRPAGASLSAAKDAGKSVRAAGVADGLRPTLRCWPTQLLAGRTIRLRRKMGRPLRDRARSRSLEAMNSINFEPPTLGRQ